MSHQPTPAQQIAQLQAQVEQLKRIVAKQVEAQRSTNARLAALEGEPTLTTPKRLSAQRRLPTASDFERDPAGATFAVTAERQRGRSGL